MLVSQVMTKNPVYIDPDSSLIETQSLMDKEKIKYLPVLDKNNTLVGIITREDLAKAGPSGATTLDMYEISYLLSQMKVSEVMINKVITVDENETIEEAARIMADKGIDSLPVMNCSVLVGIVTDTDLFNLYQNIFGERHKGVRVIITVDEKPGQIAAIATAISERGGNIVSFVSCEGEDVAHRRDTIKVKGLTKDELEMIIKRIPGVVLDDIRE
ncbi:MAG: CBS domain-containing protein [Treponema sp.]|nr:CBS domain-containing protein [Treponema sp.]